MLNKTTLTSLFTKKVKVGVKLLGMTIAPFAMLGTAVTTPITMDAFETNLVFQNKDGETAILYLNTPNTSVKPTQSLRAFVAWEQTDKLPFWQTVLTSGNNDFRAQATSLEFETRFPGAFDMALNHYMNEGLITKQCVEKMRHFKEGRYRQDPFCFIPSNN